MLFLDAVVSPIEIIGVIASQILPIVIGGIILCAAIAFVIVFLIRRKKKKESALKEDRGNENGLS